MRVFKSILLALCAVTFLTTCQNSGGDKEEPQEEELIISELTCEELENGFICYSTDGTGDKQNVNNWCIYKNLGCRGKDCPNPDPSDICVACPSNNNCPPKVSLKVKGKDARFRVQRASSSCKACPKGGYKAQFVGF